MLSAAAGGCPRAREISQAILFDAPFHPREIRGWGGGLVFDMGKAHQGDYMAGEAERTIEKIRARLEQLNRMARMWRGDPKYLETLAIDIAGVESLLERIEKSQGVKHE